MPGTLTDTPLFTALGNAVDGGYRELIAVPAVNVIPIPDSLDFNHAASVSLVFLTAWHMLVGRAGIRADEDGHLLERNALRLQLPHAIDEERSFGARAGERPEHRLRAVRPRAWIRRVWLAAWPRPVSAAV